VIAAGFPCEQRQRQRQHRIVAVRGDARCHMGGALE
jgi:hypothetical protein